MIDDRIPVDLFGRPLLVGVLPLALWPLLLSKAVLKVMAALRVTDLALPHHVSAFQLLTGWPHEDLMDPLAGVQLAGEQRISHAVARRLCGREMQSSVRALRCQPRNLAVHMWGRTGGLMFDRLEDSVRGNEQRKERLAVATVTLKKRAMPAKPPPRIIVFTGTDSVRAAATSSAPSLAVAQRGQ